MIKTKDYQTVYNEVMNNKEAKVVSYGISDNYVPNWTEKQAVTEYVANFYDENGTNFTIKEVEKGLLLEDESKRGIKLEDLVVGNSTSRSVSYKIGTHGEGFKLGALVLARNGKKVIVDTIGHTIIFYLDADKKLNSNILKSKIVKNNRTIGTTIYLESDVLEEVKDNFLFLNQNLEKSDDFFYENSSNNNYIYVNTLASQAIDSFFSYSLFKKQVVNRDRNMLESPFQDLLLELFHLTDKEKIKTWLSCMAHPQFGSSFEYEMISYFMSHNRRKVFKELDLSLFIEVANEMGLHFIARKNEKMQTAFILAYPNKHFIVCDTYDIYNFCEKFLKVPVDATSLDFGFKRKNNFFFPIFGYEILKSTAYEQIQYLYKGINNSSILKSAVLEGDTITFTLKPKGNEKVDFITGKTSPKNQNIRTAFASLYALQNEDSVSFVDWKLNKKTERQVRFLVTDAFPSVFAIKISNKKLLEELKKNILFTNSKAVIKDIVYDTKNTEKHLINSAYQYTQSIPSCFSYRISGINDMHEIFTSSIVVKRFLEKIKEQPDKKDLYEYEILQQILKTTYTHRFERNKEKMKRVLREQFIKVFGSKFVVTSSEEGDKKANYNHYRILTFEPIVNQYFELLEVCLSDDVKGSSGIEYDIIEKPTVDKIDDYLTGKYQKVISSVVVLEQSLLQLYEMTKEIYIDAKMSFVQSVLPYKSENNALNTQNETITINNSNYKRVIREYCFQILENIFLVSSFERDGKASGVRGAATREHIYVLDSSYSIGIFLHEYIHYSTGLKDICAEFEKTLILMNTLALPHLEESSTQIKSFHLQYKKWLGA